VSPSDDLDLHVQITRWIVLQKARRHRTSRLRLLVRTQFQDLFHSPSGVLLTFPSRYLFTIDRKIYLALEGGPSGFSQGFTCPDLLDKVIKRFPTLGIPGFHGLWPVFPDCSARLGNFLPFTDVSSTCYQYSDLDKSRPGYWLITCHNPCIHLRLLTYPSKLIDGSE
jgi:hypothetical protein